MNRNHKLLRMILFSSLTMVVFLLACGLLYGQSANEAAVRPGPDILYEKPATSPQLENAGIWKAQPIMISGVSAYRSGEFLYQDYLYDDRGAGQRAAYPANREKYAANAADFVEIRLKLLANETAFRITYNSLIDAELVATTIALGDAVPSAAIPFGVGGKEPASIFVTVHGSQAAITDAATGKEIAVKTPVSVDLVRRQVEVHVPYSAFDPRNKTAIRVAAATGLWDTAKNAYMAPAEPAAQGGSAAGGRGAAPAAGAARGAAAPQGRGAAQGTDAAQGRGAAPAAGAAQGADAARGAGAAQGRGGRGAQQPLNPDRALFFNAAFRYHEPLNTESTLAFYSDQQQSQQLMQGDLSPFYANVDFVKLAGGKDDNSQVPAKGFMSRILVSHFEPAQGRGSATSLGRGCTQPCIPEFAGRLQPYEIYIPTKTPPASGYGLTIDLHSASANYARWLGGSRHVQFGERGTGSIVITSNGRGLTSGYWAEAAADPFEAWADVARMYKIDPDYVTLAGVSMGAMGTFRFAGLFPDLFAAMAVSVGCPTDPIFVNHRYVPAFIHTGDLDATTNCHPGNPVLEKYLATNSQYAWWNFLQQPHAFSSIPRDWQPFADYLGMKKRTVDPPHVTFAYNAYAVEEKFGINPDHAYWISHVSIRDVNHKVQGATNANAIEGAPPPYGIVDVISYGMGKGDPVPNPVTKSKGVYKFGVDTFSWPNYDAQEETWGAAPKTPVRNALAIKAENIASVTIDPKRAKVDCNAEITVDSDGPIEVKMIGCKEVKTVTKK